MRIGSWNVYSEEHTLTKLKNHRVVLTINLPDTKPTQAYEVDIFQGMDKRYSAVVYSPGFLLPLALETRAYDLEAMLPAVHEALLSEISSNDELSHETKAWLNERVENACKELLLNLRMGLVPSTPVVTEMRRPRTSCGYTTKSTTTTTPS